jgi:hypothetical protein
MRPRFFLVTLFFAAVLFADWLMPLIASAGTENIKLPYEAGQSFVVVQGYNSPPTHIKKDLYALDLSQNGCDAYGKLAVAATAGQVMLAQESGYNGGYGTQVLVVNNSRVVARYAHLIPGTIPVAIGDGVVQGEPLGKIGNTGLVAGAACPTHPGTHIHFAMYGEADDGSFSPYFPEPISNYVAITAGKWYLSDNAIAVATIPGAAAIIDRAMQTVTGGAGLPSMPISAGSISVSPSSVAQDLAQQNSTSSIPNLPTTATTTPAIPTATAAFNTTTLAIDLSWPAAQNTSSSSSGTIVYEIWKVDPANASNTLQVGESTSTNFSYSLSDGDFGTQPVFAIATLDGSSSFGGFANLSTIQTIPISLPDWFTTTAIQPLDAENSDPSWYSDNWYDLGTGFYGMIMSLTLEGFIDSSNYFASHLWLDEYLDQNYSQLNQTFTISDNAPFTNGLRKITINDLNIPLQPNKYYRLRTYQDYQNRSVILAGTSATGTALWDEFIPGTGRVDHQYSFYPYLTALMIPRYPPLAPPVSVASIAVSFDPLSSQINVSWPATTDPDTTSSLLMYQVNVSTSTTSDAAAWQSVGKDLSVSEPVIFGNDYTLGVRAVDDLGNVGTPTTLTWHFPASYVALPQQLDHSARIPGGAQKIIVPATTTISAILLWVEPQNGDASCCDQSFLSLHADNAGSTGDEIASTTPISLSRFGQPGERAYQFPLPVPLSAGAYWFVFNEGPGRTNDTIVDGSSGDSYPDGEWSSLPGQDAYFRIEQADGP